MPSNTVEAVVEAPRALVFEVFADRERSGEYLPLRVTLDQPGTRERQGVGAVHLLRLGPLGIREQIIELVPGERMVYRVVSGLPVRSHVGTIEFQEDPRGTKVRYTMESVPSLPVPGGLVRAILQRMTTTMVQGARRTAERRHRS
ncbi:MULTISPECIES: SRPBCC family protein [unclassified Nocardia]|uniref:SRPBCC family protein n=1 Tax=unclassified Nocardia TaxID=2637762 RepID=UPI0033B45CF2